MRRRRRSHRPRWKSSPRRATVSRMSPLASRPLASWSKLHTLCAVPLLTVLGCGGDVIVDGSGGSGGDGPSAATSTGSDATSTGSVGTSATTGVGASTSTGSGGSPGDCATNDDCPGGQCVEIVPGGFRVCVTLPPEATQCDPSHTQDQCCTSADCAAQGGGRCYDNQSIPFCGGAFPAPENVCFVDSCTADADCFGGTTGETVCAPAGVSGFPGKSCVMTFCRADSDCTAQAGGICAPVQDACCGLVAGLACIYPDGCRSNADCATGGCVLDTVKGIGRCEPNGVPCPAAQ